MSPRTTPPARTFDGFASPNYTQVPDELFDVLMPRLTDAELRVLLYIVRRTFGFKRDADRISLSQMVSGITTRDGHVLDSGTGLSKATVARGLKGLREKGMIEAYRNHSTARGDEPTTYRLRFKQPSSRTTTEITPVSHERDTPRVSNLRQAVSQPRDTQHTGNKRTDFESSKKSTFAETGDQAWDRDPDLPTTPSQPSGPGLQPIGAALQRRAVPKGRGEEQQAIAATVDAFAAELGDKASKKATRSRAMNLFATSGLSQAAFIDVLYQAKGEVRDRRQHPGKAPLLRNQMAYFFAVVEDRLSMRHG